MPQKNILVLLAYRSVHRRRCSYSKRITMPYSACCRSYSSEWRRHANNTVEGFILGRKVSERRGDCQLTDYPPQILESRFFFCVSIFVRYRHTVRDQQENQQNESQHESFFREDEKVESSCTEIRVERTHFQKRNAAWINCPISYQLGVRYCSPWEGGIAHLAAGSTALKFGVGAQSRLLSVSHVKRSLRQFG